MWGKKSHHLIILISACLILLSTWIRFIIQSRTSPAKDISIQHEDAVELIGHVQKPGIYFLPRGSNLASLLEIAGERKLKEILSPWELGLILLSGQKIKIEKTPRKGQWISIFPMEASKLFLLHIPIDLNTASEEDLMVIPGIGPKTAKAIVDYRNRHGPFRTLADLENISGIGPKKMADFSKHLIVRPASHQDRPAVK